MLEAPGTKRLKRKGDEPPSNFAFKFNLRRYNSDDDSALVSVLVPPPPPAMAGRSAQGIPTLSKLFVVTYSRRTVGRCKLTVSNPR